MNVRNPARAARRRWWIVLVATALAAGTALVSSATWATIDDAGERVLTACIAALIGLVIGLVGALVIDSLDDTVRGERDLQADIDGQSPPPVLAVVPVEPTPTGRAATVAAPDGRVAEIYEALGRNLHVVGLHRPARIIQITSSLPGEGSTTTVADLAVGLARSGHSVAAVDADLRKPALHRLFATPPVPGLADILQGESVDFVAVPLSLPGGVDLVLVPAGDTAERPSGVLSGTRWHEVIHGLAQRFDSVLVDSAAVLPSDDAMALADVVDAVLLVVRADRTSWSDVVESVGRLRASGCFVGGFVLTQAKRGAPGRFLAERLRGDAEALGSATIAQQGGPGA
jgi:succinoglycan biosynthesis transport protein ExoP